MVAYLALLGKLQRYRNSLHRREIKCVIDECVSLINEIADAETGIVLTKRAIAGVRQGEAAALSNLDLVFRTVGQVAQARAHWQQALAIALPPG